MAFDLACFTLKTHCTRRQDLPPQKHRPWHQCRLLAKTPPR